MKLQDFSRRNQAFTIFNKCTELSKAFEEFHDFQYPVYFKADLSP